jgi:uncharacterized protein YkwD
MGRHTDPAIIGSRRAAVVTLVVSALLVLGGFVILNQARDLRILPDQPPTPSAPTTPTSRVDDVEEPSRTPPTTGGGTQSTPASTLPSATASPRPSLTTRAPAPLVTAAPPARTPTARPSGAPSPTTSAASSVPPPRAGVAHQVVALVNIERARAGCDPVSADAALQSAAQGHSDDMAARDYFSHTSPAGSTFADRIRAAGYRGGSIAENIAAGQRSAKAVMDAWMASPGHRANILNCTYRDIGVGYATGGSYGTYWTQTFGG